MDGDQVRARGAAVREFSRVEELLTGSRMSQIPRDSFERECPARKTADPATIYNVLQVVVLVSHTMVSYISLVSGRPNPIPVLQPVLPDTG